MATVAEKLKAIADKIRFWSRSENLLTLDDMADGVDSVFDNGYFDGWDNGYVDGEEDGWNDGYGEGLDHGVVQGIEEGIEQGKRDAYDYFWDTYQQNGERVDYICAFGSQWTPELFKPKYQIKANLAGYMFFNNMGNYFIIPDFVEFADNLAREQGKTIEEAPELFDENGHYNLIDFSDCNTALYALAGLHSNHFGRLDFSNCINMNYMFYSHNYGSTYPVKKIDNFISSEKTVFNNAFDQAIYLTDITMDGVVAKSINFGTCPLNKASIISVVNVLSPSTTGQTVTFKKTAVNTAFGINVDDVSTYPVGSEFYNLRNSKPNWTFSYA